MHSVGRVYPTAFALGIAERSGVIFESCIAAPLAEHQPLEEAHIIPGSTNRKENQMNKIRLGVIGTGNLLGAIAGLSSHQASHASAGIMTRAPTPITSIPDVYTDYDKTSVAMI
jgi:hypothetical protein